jgi:hypothetical protein
MENCEDDNVISIPEIKKQVRKSPHHALPGVFVDFWIHFGMALDRPDTVINATNEFRAQAALALLVPFVRLPQISLGGRSE